MISRISRFMTTIVSKYMRATGFSSAIGIIIFFWALWGTEHSTGALVEMWGNGFGICLLSQCRWRWW